jgi:two-component system NtrC family sensor kinase
MKLRYFFPIRFKILIALLVVVTAVVALITFTMAKLLHADKKVYIHDLTSVIALHTASEARTLLDGYRERLMLFAKIHRNRSLSGEQKEELLKRLFEDIREIVAVTFYEGKKARVAAYDEEILKDFGLSREVLRKDQERRPIPFERLHPGTVLVENSTVSSKMPCMTLFVSLSAGKGKEPEIITAVILLDNLMRLAKRSKAFETFLVDSRGILLAHPNETMVISGMSADWIPDRSSLQGGLALGATYEYRRNGVDMVGGFANVEFGDVISGVQIPSAAAFLTARELLRNLMAVSLVLLVVAALMALFWSSRMTRPIERLSDATQVVGKGRFDIQVESTSHDEIGELAQSFTRMASELNMRERALLDAQAQLIQSEKLAAFGQLGAGIAHEVKNPLAGILGIAQLAMRGADRDSPLQKDLSIIEKEARRCKMIIENLLKFARQEKVAHEQVVINRMLEDTAALLNHQLGIHLVRLETELSPDLPPVTGNANQLQQVVMNLIINAQQAMEGQKGTVRVTSSRPLPGWVEIRVSDTGPGIPKEIQAKLFEPFFTTKPAGKGTGLGLSVSYGIIKDHKGEIRVESEPGEGATFIIHLPVRESVEATTPEAVLT